MRWGMLGWHLILRKRWQHKHAQLHHNWTHRVSRMNLDYCLMVSTNTKTICLWAYHKNSSVTVTTVVYCSDTDWWYLGRENISTKLKQSDQWTLMKREIPWLCDELCASTVLDQWCVCGASIRSTYSRYLCFCGQIMSNAMGGYANLRLGVDISNVQK
jgi:hypothetical protein